MDCSVLRRLYVEEGLPVSEIAKVLDISVSKLYNMLRRCGIELRHRRRRRRTPQVEEEAVRLYLEGVPVRVILEKLGISASTLYAILSEYGVRLRRGKSPSAYRRLTREEIDEILRLWRQGLGARRIARIVGRPVSTVSYVITTYGRRVETVEGSTHDG